MEKPLLLEEMVVTLTNDKSKSYVSESWKLPKLHNDFVELRDLLYKQCMHDRWCQLNSSGKEDGRHETKII